MIRTCGKNVAERLNPDWQIKAMKERGRRRNPDRTPKGGLGHEPPGNFFNLGLINSLEMQRKLPRSMKCSNLCSPRVTQISKAEG